MERRKLHRRSGERRSLEVAVSIDRRSDELRRNTPDRRRDTPATFSDRESAGILDLMRQARAELTCPRCGGPVLVGEPVGEGDAAVRQARCNSCRRIAMIPVSGLP